MSKMSTLDLEIREMIDEGFRPFTISQILSVPISFVYEVYDTLDEESNTEVFNPYNTVNS